MNRRLQQFLCMLLGVLITLTAGLYITANAEQIIWALQALQPAPEVEILDPPPMPLGGVVAISAPLEPQQEQPLPLFAYPYLLRSLGSEVAQAVLVLGGGDEGNLWLLRRAGERWEVQLGPLHCRTGWNGIALRKQEGDGKTPGGITAIGLLYSAGDSIATGLRVQPLQSGTVWCTDPNSNDYNRPVPAEMAQSALPLDQGPYLDIGYNSACIPGEGSAVLLFAQADSAPTAGGIALSPADMARLLALLNAGSYPAMAIFHASDVGWTVEPGMPEHFVRLSEAAPDVLERPSYASHENFMGRPMAGYLGHRVVVTREVAAVLQQIAEQLAPRGLRLLVYDGYRPERAVRDIFAWIADEGDQTMKQQYYPELEKHQLPGVYLDRSSPHCTGIAVDLTLCSENGVPLDMGTGFDFFSPRSWVLSGGLTEQQQQNRLLLREVMLQAGFSPYNSEWWHFNYMTGSRAVVYDFVIPQ